MLELICATARPLLGTLDDPDIYNGAPIDVQSVARKYEEEKIWAIAKIVTAALNASVLTFLASGNFGRCMFGSIDSNALVRRTT